MKKVMANCLGLFMLALFFQASAQKGKPVTIFQLTVYHFANSDQEARLDSYLKDALLPALHRKGFAKVGVFKPIANDTAADKRIYVLLPLANISQAGEWDNLVGKDAVYTAAADAYINTGFRDPAYGRIENILLKPFRLAQQLTPSGLSGDKTKQVYELRSYESPSEKRFRNKVHMFNEGGEIELFKRLNFNAVFYGEVIAGATMPNLMYMTSFSDMADREAHWKSFGEAPEWKKLIADPYYKENMNKNVQVLMHATAYSDY
ncbi:NIPSNAP family protein [Flavihumibacter rivuli]|uniref:NIPSNAP family protein n=1 Tax=Flavihumibacter rivuli TaxID=2838156 RepID=UPI001BDF0030|nr:NIPSNAP family protein [Flavihumibacter rivuli]ULQ58301.1 NIPSNAP family protein [Flavihumibacter rivuli]